MNDNGLYAVIVYFVGLAAGVFLALALFGCAGYRCAPNTERPGVTCVRR